MLTRLFLTLPVPRPHRPDEQLLPILRDGESDKDLRKGLVRYSHLPRRRLARLGKSLACGIPTFLARNKDQITILWQYLSFMLLPLIIPVISFIDSFTKSNSVYLTQRGFSTLKYQVIFFTIPIPPKIQKHLILINANISLTTFTSSYIILDVLRLTKEGYIRT